MILSRYSIFSRAFSSSTFKSQVTMSEKLSAQSDILKWSSSDGAFRRQVSAFRDFISKDPNSKFPAEKGRYWLYASLACPWAHRTLIVRKLKGLQDIIGVAYVHPFMGSLGWSFDGEGYEGQGAPKDGIPNLTGDPLYNSKHIRELYFKAEPEYSGRFTVPTLWDSKQKTIVSNESAEIIRMFNTEFDDIIEDKYKGVTYYPDELGKDIDQLNEWVYNTVNNGVYKSGFATKEEPYLENVKLLFESLDKLESILSAKYSKIGPKDEAFLIGNQLTEADIRLFTTIIRFDPVYHGHFKCNLRTIRDGYPSIHRWMQNLYWSYPAFNETTDFHHIKIHYYNSHRNINPTGIVPLGPQPPILPIEK